MLLDVRRKSDASSWTDSGAASANARLDDLSIAAQAGRMLGLM